MKVYGNKYEKKASDWNSEMKKTLPDDPDAITNYAATGFISSQRGKEGIPLILPIDAAAKTTYRWSINIVTQRTKCLASFTEENTIDGDDYLLKRDLFELALIEARAAKSYLYRLP